MRASAEEIAASEIGDRMPLVPLHQVKLGADCFVTPAWQIGADLVAYSSQYFAGDESNQAAKLPFMTGGAAEMALTVRTQFGAGRSSGGSRCSDRREAAGPEPPCRSSPPA